ncbi:MAG: hypothetical protein ABW088_12525 [Sedimenticola sp.]
MNTDINKYLEILEQERRNNHESMAYINASVRLIKTSIQGLYMNSQDGSLDPRDIASVQFAVMELVSVINDYYQELTNLMGHIPDASEFMSEGLSETRSNENEIEDKLIH